MLEKNQMRAWLKSKRLAMTDEEVGLSSQHINQRLMSILNFEQIKSINCYQPIASLNEVSLEWLNNKLGEYPEIDVSFQDKTGLETAHPSYDVIIVPMLGFDNSGHRLGWGGGFYDKFLATQSKALKIGLCYEAGKLKSIPAEPHDIPLDIVITEEGIYRPIPSSK